MDAALVAAPAAWHVSASQVETFTKCQRAWFNRSVLRLPAPSTAAQGLGTQIHSALEAYNRHGTFPADPVMAEFVALAAHEIPPPGVGEPEREISLETYPGGPRWIGFVDLYVPGDVPQIIDYKTTSDFRYIKAPDDLLASPQMMSYARWALDGAHVGTIAEVKLTHVYLRTRGKKSVKRVDATAPRAQILDVWERDVATVRMMERIRQTITESDDVSPTGVDTGHCNAYGGCPYRSRCGLDTTPSKGVTTVPDPNKPSSLLEKILAAKAKLAASEAAPTPDNVVPLTPQAGVVPPDAPPREQPAPAAVAPAVAPAAPAPTPAPPEDDIMAAALAASQAMEAAEPAAEPPKTKRGPGRPRKTPAPRCPVCTHEVRIADDDLIVAHTNGNGEECYVSGWSLEEAEAEAAEVAKAKAEQAKAAPPPAPAPTVSPAISPEEQARAAEAHARAAAIVAQTEALRQAAAEATPKGHHPGLTPRPAVSNLVLYVDCTPVKGADRKDVELFEDFIAPIAAAAAEVNNVHDYRLISYTSKGVLATAIRAALANGQIPRVLQISSATPGSDVALEVLVPYARTVVRALRG